MVKEEIVQNNRLEYLDFLRGGAALAVVFYHCGAQGLPSQLITLLLNWCVPMFFFISGALFFRSDYPVSMEKMLKRNIPKILTILLFWGLVYNLLSLIIIERNISVDLCWRALKMVIIADTTYGFQFWYLYALVGVYLFMPLLKPWTDKIMAEETPSKECNLTFGIFFTLSIILPTIMQVIGYEGSVWKNAFVMFTAYVFYTLCGQWLSKWRLSLKMRIVSIIIILAHLVVFAYWMWQDNFDTVLRWIGYTSVFTCLLTMLLFDAVRRLPLSKVCRPLRRIAFSLSKYSLGIYILHVMVFQAIRKVGIDFAIINPWIFPLLCTAIITMICWIISYMLKKIKFVSYLL